MIVDNASINLSAKMKLLQINTFYGYGSTGYIMRELKKIAERHGIESYAAFGHGFTPKADEKETIYRIESDRELLISKLWTKVTGHHGFNNKTETKRL